jgi:hypothetical protein
MRYGIPYVDLVVIKVCIDHLLCNNYLSSLLWKCTSQLMHVTLHSNSKQLDRYFCKFITITSRSHMPTSDVSASHTPVRRVIPPPSAAPGSKRAAVLDQSVAKGDKANSSTHPPNPSSNLDSRPLRTMRIRAPCNLAIPALCARSDRLPDDRAPVAEPELRFAVAHEGAVGRAAGSLCSAGARGRSGSGSGSGSWRLGGKVGS